MKFDDARVQRIDHATAEWLDLEPDWTVEHARAAAMLEETIIHGATSDGTVPQGLLGRKAEEENRS